MKLTSMIKSPVAFKNWSPVMKRDRHFRPVSSHGVLLSGNIFYPTDSLWQRYHQTYGRHGQNFPKKTRSPVIHSRFVGRSGLKYPDHQFRSTQSGLSTISLIIAGLFFAILVATDKEEPQFQYPPLDPATDGIRLLILQPGRRGTRIKCDLVST